MKTQIELDITFEKLDSKISGQAWGIIRVGGFPIFQELVYDNPNSPAERNTLLLFSSRMQKLLADSVWLSFMCL